VAQGGVLLVNRTPPVPNLQVGDGFADIEARARWDSVEADLNKQGVAGRVLTNTLGLSVGGTISVGGFGVRSIRWGAQVDNVESLRLILPDGTPIDASAAENAELFHFALAGLGSVGVIERVRMRTMPMPVCSRAYVSRFRSWEALIDILGEIASLPEGEGPDAQPMELVAACKPNGAAELQQRYYFPSHEAAQKVVSLTAPRSAPAVARQVETRPAFTDSRAVDAWVAGFGVAHRVWGDYVMDYSGFREFMAEVWTKVAARAPGFHHLPWVYLLILRAPSTGVGRNGASVFSPTVGATGTHRFGCGFYNMVPKDQPRAAKETFQACLEMSRRCIELGGRPYLHGVASLPEAVRRRLYGESYNRLRALRNTLDPDGLFNPNWFATDAEASRADWPE
jgi:FAD/FMN-containing dehydrogenase